MRVWRRPLKSSGGASWTHQFSQVPTREAGEEEGHWIPTLKLDLAAALTLDLVGCARCQGEGHLDLTFWPPKFPIEFDGEQPLTHWAPCPTNGQPILLRYTEDVEPEPTPVERDS